MSETKDSKEKQIDKKVKSIIKIVDGCPSLEIVENRRIYKGDLEAESIIIETPLVVDGNILCKNLTSNFQLEVIYDLVADGKIKVNSALYVKGDLIAGSAWIGSSLHVNCRLRVEKLEVLGYIDVL